MHEPPPITITDPRDPQGTADVLVSGDERAPLLPRRVVVIGVALALIVGGTVVGVDRYREHRAKARAAAAAFAIADTVHTRVALADDGVLAFFSGGVLFDPASGEEEPGSLPETGRLVVPLLVTDDPEGFTQLRDIQVTGTGVAAEFDPAQLATRQPGTTARVEVPVRIDCGDVAAGRYPSLTAAVVSLVPESGRVHRVTVPVASSPERALEACQLPEPDAVPRAGIEEQHGRLLVLIEPRPRSGLALHVLEITSPGLSLALVDKRIPPNTSLLQYVSVRVTDCAAARAGAGTVTVSLREGEHRWSVVAQDNPASEYRRPGSTWIEHIVDRACP